MSTREASRVFGLHRDTVHKMLAYSVPPGYRRRQPPRRPRIGPYHRPGQQLPAHPTGARAPIGRSPGWIVRGRPRITYGAGSRPSQEAAPHRQAHPRPTEGRVRLRRQVHDRQGTSYGSHRRLKASESNCICATSLHGHGMSIPFVPASQDARVLGPPGYRRRHAQCDFGTRPHRQADRS